MKQVDALRKIIREEVRAVFQQELAGILKEAVMSNREQRLIVETAKPRDPIPGTLNKQAPRLVPPSLGASNPLNNLLAETAMTMTARDFEGIHGGTGYEQEVQVGEDVNSMLSSAKKSAVLEGVEINEVPDFTAIMSKMKATGQI